MGKQVLGGFLAVCFVPLACFLYYTTNCREILAAGKAVPLPGHRQAVIEPLVKLNKKNFIAGNG